MNVALALALTGCLILLGRWGLKRAPALVPGHFDPETRERKIRALRRGAWMCQVFAGIFAIVAIVRLLR